MNQVFQTIGFGALLFGLTVTADKALNKTARKDLGDYIKSLLDGVNPAQVNVRNPLSFLDSVSPFSWHSARLSIIFSLAALVVVVYIQYFALGYNFSEIITGVSPLDANRFLAFFLFIFLGNFFVDYISFTQTLVILRLANKTDSKKSLFILFFTDLLATINIFTFFYAAFLAIGIIVFFNYTQKVEFVVGITDGEKGDEFQNLVRETGISGAEKFTVVYNYSAYLRIGDRYRSGSSGYLFSSSPVAIDAMEPLVAAALSPSSITSRKITRVNGKFELFRSLEENYQFSGELNYPIISSKDFAPWYSAAYLQTDAVQDNFIEVARLMPGFQPINSVKTTANAMMLAGRQNNTVALWCLSSNVPLAAQIGPCENVLALISRGASSLSEEAANWYNIGGKLPLYTFLFTSLTLTVAIYFSYLIFLTISILSRFGRSISMPISKYGNLEEYPVTFAAAPAVSLVTLIYWCLS